MSILRSYLDRRKAAQAAQEIFKVLVHARRQGQTGVDLPNRDDSPLVIQELLRLHPELKVVRMATTLTVTFDEDLKAGTSAELYDSFSAKGAIFGNK